MSQHMHDMGMLGKPAESSTDASRVPTTGPYRNTVPASGADHENVSHPTSDTKIGTDFSMPVVASKRAVATSQAKTGYDNDTSSNNNQKTEPSHDWLSNDSLNKPSGSTTFAKTKAEPTAMPSRRSFGHVDVIL